MMLQRGESYGASISRNKGFHVTRDSERDVAGNRELQDYGNPEIPGSREPGISVPCSQLGLPRYAAGNPLSERDAAGNPDYVIGHFSPPSPP